MKNIQLRAIASLAEGKSIAEVARLIHRSRKTIHSWLHDSEFEKELSRLQSLVFGDLSRRLGGLGDSAITVLQALLSQAQRGDSVKKSASVAVLELLLKYRQVTDLEERLSNLERIVNV